jgi:hypothetical protein
VATFRRSLDDDARVTSSSANGVDRYRDHQGHRHQDDRHQDHRNRHLGDRHQDHQDDLVRHLGDRHRDHLDHLDDRLDHQDHQVRVCQGQMDALVHQYLLDRDQVHLQEYGQCEHQHQDQQDGHPLVDDQRQAPHLGDQEAAELDDRYLEEAE